MSAHSHLTSVVLLLVLFVLASSTGCQKQAATDKKEELSDMTKRVTVEITGMS